MLTTAMIILFCCLGSHAAFPAEADSSPVEEFHRRWSSLFDDSRKISRAEGASDMLEAFTGDRGLETRFEEVKQIAVLTRPLHSTGRLIYLPGRGLSREMLTPFREELVITPKAIHRRDARGNTEEIPLESRPVAQAFVQSFLALFSGSVKELEAHFKLYFEGAEDGWKLGLVPRNAPMAGLIRRMVLTGQGSRLNDLWVLEDNGDVTHDRFESPQMIPPGEYGRYASHFTW